MKLYFNELALDDFPEDIKKGFEHFREAWNMMCRVVPELELVYNNDSVGDIFAKIDPCECRSVFEFFTTCIQRAEYDDADLERLLSAKYTVADGKQKVECLTLAWAMLQNTHTFGISSKGEWEKPIHKVVIQDNSGRYSDREVYCISTADHLHNTSVSAWFEANMAPPTLVESPKSVDEKFASFSNRQDHGMEVLEEFVKKLLHSKYSKYIDAPIWSQPFLPYCNQFVSSFERNGKIRLCLHWTDCGYSLLVQTTGRNWRETQYISNLLNEDKNLNRRGL